MIPGIGTCNADRCFRAINHGKVEYKGVELGAGISPLDNLNIILLILILIVRLKKHKIKV